MKTSIRTCLLGSAILSLAAVSPASAETTAGQPKGDAAREQTLTGDIATNNNGKGGEAVRRSQREALNGEPQVNVDSDGRVREDSSQQRSAQQKQGKKNQQARKENTKGGVVTNKTADVTTSDDQYTTRRGDLDRSQAYSGQPRDRNAADTGDDLAMNRDNSNRDGNPGDRTVTGQSADTHSRGGTTTGRSGSVPGSTGSLGSSGAGRSGSTTTSR